MYITETQINFYLGKQSNILTADKSDRFDSASK